MINKIKQVIQHSQRDELMTKFRNAEKKLHTWDKVSQDYNNFIERIDIETSAHRYL